ncbi:MAG: hypothetical protein QG597_271 [Actinomycetota bacterium]|nr:hypothetical protein [Actinomycetota bacterium]
MHLRQFILGFGVVVLGASQISGCSGEGQAGTASPYAFYTKTSGRTFADGSVVGVRQDGNSIKVVGFNLDGSPDSCFVGTSTVSGSTQMDYVGSRTYAPSSSLSGTPYAQTLRVVNNGTSLDVVATDTNGSYAARLTAGATPPDGKGSEAAIDACPGFGVGAPPAPPAAPTPAAPTTVTATPAVAGPAIESLSGLWLGTLAQPGHPAAEGQDYVSPMVYDGTLRLVDDGSGTITGHYSDYQTIGSPNPQSYDVVGTYKEGVLDLSGVEGTQNLPPGDDFFMNHFVLRPGGNVLSGAFYKPNGTYMGQVGLTRSPS